MSPASEVKDGDLLNMIASIRAPRGSNYEPAIRDFRINDKSSIGRANFPAVTPEFLKKRMKFTGRILIAVL